LVSAVSLATEIVCVLAGLGFALVGRRWLIRRMGWDAVLGPVPLRDLVLGVGVAMILAGAVPFVVQLSLANAAQEQGFDAFDRQLYAAALVPLERAERIFSGVGLESSAQDVRIPLLQTYGAIGEWEQVESTIDELRSHDLDAEQEGSLLWRRRSSLSVKGSWKRRRRPSSRHTR
jgi:hypothetical protein